jgi:hypothetical protein
VSVQEGGTRSLLPALRRLAGAALLGCVVLHGPLGAQGPPASAPDASAPASSPQPAAKPCTLVFGHGRNPSDDDPAANAQWDDVNRALASQVALEIAERDIRTVLVLAPVTLTDVGVIVRNLVDNATREGCDRIVETTLFAQDAELLVVRLREYPVRGGSGTAVIGEPRYNHRQEYPNTARNRDRLVPARLGRTFAEDYLRQRGSP